MANKTQNRLLSVQKKLLLRTFLAMLEEDVGYRDVTTSSLISELQQAKCLIFSRESGVIAGIELAGVFLKELGAKIASFRIDGEQIEPNELLLECTGPASLFLTVERTLLNLLQRMCGIATITATMLTKARKKNPQVRLAATRKTAPLLRVFDKMAVIAGGGDPHRWNLDDAVLIKDNHLAFFENIEKAIQRARSSISFTCPIEVEVTSLQEAKTAAQSGADALLFDNMAPSKVRKTVEALRKLNLPRPPLIEVSGNITLDNIELYAATGVDVISAGMLTHSVKALDLSMDVIPIPSIKEEDQTD
jgi:nicotinate-nucleotide pyrophosphorylase (carboxylating)